MNATPRTIGIYGFAMHEVVHRPFMGVLRYCEEEGNFSVSDLRTLDVIDHDGRILPPPWGGCCEGVIISTGRGPNLTDAQTADWVVSGGVPAVSVSGDWHDPRVPCVHTDQRSVGILAAKYLDECDCKSFLYVGYASSSGSKIRGEAFRTALEERKRKVTLIASKWHFLGVGGDKEGLQQETAIGEALQKLPKPLGVWTLNDCFAAAICVECQRLGLSIPHDVRVLGTDDLSIGRTLNPALSSIRTPGETIGYRAMNILHRMLDGKRVMRKETEVANCELVVRGTTSARGSGFSTISVAADYIARHACTGVTVEHVADSLGMSRRAFVDQFRQHVGRLPSREIQRVRLEQAKNLLRHADVSVSRIASMVGFEETAAFSKFFRKHTGMSPREFRQQQSQRPRDSNDGQ